MNAMHKSEEKALKIASTLNRYQPETYEQFAKKVLTSYSAASVANQDAEVPDEIVEGLMVRGQSSILYGDSNSGKTFAVIDLAASISRGSGWMGRRTEKGLVIYLAVESPSSLKTRTQAYQRHHGVQLDHFHIVPNPIDLFGADEDEQMVIDLVKRIEKEAGQKALLIVGDTLARMAPGANENAGQDMGLVIQRMDRIRLATGAHFTLIHHSGKNAAAGARGWSGVRAAVDTELEVTATEGRDVRTIEITKQRDLPGKGDRIGFTLTPVEIGTTKWGKPFTSCVVAPAEAPQKPKQARRVSEVDGAVAEFLRSKGMGVKKGAIVEHFAGRYDKSSIYRSIRSGVASGLMHEVLGMVALLKSGE